MEAEDIPFELDARQRLMTHFFTPQRGELNGGKRQSRRSMHELGKGHSAGRGRASLPSDSKSARSRSRKSRKTHSSVY